MTLLCMLGRGQVRLKTPSNAMLAWMREGEQEQLQSAKGRLHIAAKTILTAGAKSLTHTSTYVERYQALLRELLADVGPEVC